MEDCTYDAVLGLSILHLLENKEQADRQGLSNTQT